MKRAIVLLVMILSLVAFVDGSVSAGAEQDAGRLANAGCPFVQTGSQPDSSRMPASCASPCILCVAGLVTLETSHAQPGDLRAEGPLPLVNQGLPGTLYRPPKPWLNFRCPTIDNPITKEPEDA